MKYPINIRRPLDKVLYRPISIQNEREQAARNKAIDARLAANSIRPEKRNGILRPSRTTR